MNTPLDRLAAMVAKMTPGEWYEEVGVKEPKQIQLTHDGLTESIPRRFFAQGPEHRESAEAHNDAAGIVALRNAAEELIAIAKAAFSVTSEDRVREELCSYTQGIALLEGLAALEAKLATEPGI